MKTTPHAKSPVARATKTRTTRWKWGSTAGARKAQICHRTTGSAIAKAAMRLTLTEVVNGSVTPSVTSCLSSGSGPVSHSMIRSWKANVTANAGASASRLTMIRARSSSRCSTSVASSPCRRRFGRNLRRASSGNG